MRTLFRIALAVGAIAGNLLAAGIIRAATEKPAPAIATPVGDPTMRDADRAWVIAVAKSDKAAAAKLLDSGFMWTDANGKTRTREQAAQSLPAPLLGDDDGAQVLAYTYGQVAVVEANSGTAHVLRVWVKRPAGWRILIYQEVKSLDAPPVTTPGAGKTCENPCKTVPFQPKNADEKAAIESYMGLESSAVAHDADKWGAYTADEFIAASSNSNKLLDRPTRVAELRNSKMSGLSPTPLLSARMFDFPGAIIMTSLHKPDHGNNLQITRVWVWREGMWRATLSYQTAIRGAAQGSN